MMQSAQPNIYAGDDDHSFRDLLCGELNTVGFEVRDVGPMMVGQLGSAVCLFSVSDTNFQSFEAWRTLKNKVLTRSLLRRLDMSHAHGSWFRRDDVEKAREFVAACGRAVIKPARGSKGRGVSVDVTVETFDQAWNAAWVDLISSQVLIETFFEGEEARYLVIDHHCVAVLRRRPPSISGDGVSTISQLIQAKNRVRQANPHLRDKPLTLDAHRIALLRSKGFSSESVLPVSKELNLDPKGNLSTGADSEDITDQAHPSYRAIAERISRAVNGAHAIGVDILSQDHTGPSDPSRYIIIEANTGPGLLGHYYPMFGERRNAFKLLAESCARRLRQGEARHQDAATSD